MNIQNAIRAYGAKNIVVQMMGSPLKIGLFGLFAYTTPSDEQVLSLFRIGEEKNSDCYEYKIRFVPVDPRIASERLYTMDFNSKRDHDPDSYKIFIQDSDGYTRIY